MYFFECIFHLSDVEFWTHSSIKIFSLTNFLLLFFYFFYHILYINLLPLISETITFELHEVIINNNKNSLNI